MCDQDNQLLKGEVRERAMISYALTTISIRDEAVKVNTPLFVKGVNFLRGIGCERLAINLDHEESNTPSRSLINRILTMVEATMQDPIFIDGKRFYFAPIKLLMISSQSLVLLLQTVQKSFITQRTKQ